MWGLDQTMTIYTPNGTTGAYDVVSASSIACRLAFRLTQQGGADDANAPREEMTGQRILLWGPSTAMPANAQIEVDSVRWNIHEQTVVGIRGPSGSVRYYRAEVTEATS